MPRVPTPGVPQNLPPVINPTAPTAGNHMVPPMGGFGGPYARQALQMAGLLGNPEFNPPGNIQTQMGLLGGPPKGFRVPFYRPPGK